MTIPEIDKDFLRRQLPEFSGQTADYHNEKIGKIATRSFPVTSAASPSATAKAICCACAAAPDASLLQSWLHSQDDPQI